MIRSGADLIEGDTKKGPLSNLPDFMTEDPDVRNLLVEWQSAWVSKYDIDYYRVDTVKHVDDTTWAAFKNALTRIDPDFKMIGEYAGAGYASDTGTLRSGEMDSLLDFDFNDQALAFVKGDIDGVEIFMEKRNAAIDNTATLGAFTSSHDEDGLMQKIIDLLFSCFFSADMVLIGLILQHSSAVVVSCLVHSLWLLIMLLHRSHQWDRSSLVSAVVSLPDCSVALVQMQKVFLLQSS